MSQEAPNIYLYSDYRRYFQDLFQFKKDSCGSSYSHRKFAEFIGFESESGVRHLLVGRRNITKPRLTIMANTLPFSRAEKEYFVDLVRWNQAEDINDAVFYFDRLSKQLMRFYVKEISGNRAELLLTKWYYVVIREMALLETFQSDPEWISDRLAKMVSPAEAQEALDMLIANGYLRRTGNRYVAVERTVKIESGMAQRMLDMLHVQTICTSLKAVKHIDPIDREIHSITLSLDKERFDKLRRYLRDCLCSFVAEANGVVSPKNVCQCNIQFFKLTPDE